MGDKVLVVDDNYHIVRLIETFLVEQGYEVVKAYTAEEGVRLAKTDRPSLALLDVLVPSMGGWEICRQIREFSDMPVIFLTALGQVENVVRGLELGADDYVVKPFQREELLARIKAQLRRASTSRTSETYIFGDGELVIDLPARSVKLRDEEISLTPREFDLLSVLVRNESRVVTTNELVQEAWGLNYRDAGYNIKPYIHYLRRKLEDEPSKPRWIRTARGVGYRFTGDS